MRKTSGFKIVLGLLILAALSSCSDNPALRSRYEAEKRFDHAERTLKNVLALNSNLTPSTLAQVSGEYRNLLAFCVNSLKSTDSMRYPVEYNELTYLAYQTSNRLGQLYYSSGQADSCILLFNRMLNTLSLSGAQLANAYINLGQTLQSSNMWDSALVVYDNAIERFYPPIDKAGEIIFPVFNLPTHIYRVLSYLRDTAAARNRFNQAENYYRNLVTDYPGTKVAIASHSNLASMYDDSRQWRKEIAELNAIADPSKPSYLTILIRKADIYGGQLGKFDTAMALYNETLDRLKPEDSAMKPEVQFKIAILKMDQKEYAEARAQIEMIKKLFPDYYAATPAIQYTYARAYELDGKWNLAQNEYDLLIEKYRYSEEAMQTYLYLVKYFRDHGRTSEADKWHRDAEQYFSALESSGAGRQDEARALLYKADLYRLDKNWTKTAQTLQTVFNKFPRTSQGSSALAEASEIYRTQLNNPQKADSLRAILQSSLTTISEDTTGEDLFNK